MYNTSVEVTLCDKHASLRYGRVVSNGTVYSAFIMEQHTLKNVNNCLNTNIYSYLTSGGQSSNPYLNVVHLLNTRAD